MLFFEVSIEEEFFVDNLLVRIHFIIEMIWWTASRHGSLNSLFQVALYPPSYHFPSYITIRAHEQRTCCARHPHEFVVSTPPIVLHPPQNSPLPAPTTTCRLIHAQKEQHFHSKEQHFHSKCYRDSAT